MSVKSRSRTYGSLMKKQFQRSWLNVLGSEVLGLEQTRKDHLGWCSYMGLMQSGLIVCGFGDVRTVPMG